MGQIPQYILSTGIALGAIIFAVAFSWSQLRRGTVEALKENNQALTDLLKTDKEEFEKMNQRITAQGREIAALQAKVTHLESVNGDFKTIITDALKYFFDKYPDRAVDMSKKVVESVQ